MDLLAGALIQRVDVAARAIALHVRVPGESAMIVLAAMREGTKAVTRVGVLGVDARRAAWGTSKWPLVASDAARRQVRAMLEGGKVIAITPERIVVERGDAYEVIVEGARVVVRKRTAREVEEGVARAEDRAAWNAKGEAIARALAVGGIEEKRAAARAAIERTRVKLVRRIAAVKGDLARIGDADALSAQAQWLVAEAGRAPRGARSLTVTDWSTGEARSIEVPLNPALPARLQVEAMFQRARRLKKGAHVALERLASTEQTIARLADLTRDVEAADATDAIDAVLAAARRAAPRDFRAPSNVAAARATATLRSFPYRTFVTGAGARILVGRGAAQNDALTFHTAKPHDVWLHTKEKTGAHVIVPLAKNREPPSDLLVDAAHLAAHFSDARGEGVVDVQYTARKHLRKPKGGAPGMVIVEREKVLVLRVDEARLRALLEREEVDQG